MAAGRAPRISPRVRTQVDPAVVQAERTARTRGVVPEAGAWGTPTRTGGAAAASVARAEAPAGASSFTEVPCRSSGSSAQRVATGGPADAAGTAAVEQVAGSPIST